MSSKNRFFKVWLSSHVSANLEYPPTPNLDLIALPAALPAGVAMDRRRHEERERDYPGGARERASEERGREHREDRWRHEKREREHVHEACSRSRSNECVSPRPSAPISSPRRSESCLGAPLTTRRPWVQAPGVERAGSDRQAVGSGEGSRRQATKRGTRAGGRLGGPGGSCMG